MIFFFLILVVNLSNLFTFQLMWCDLKVVLTVLQMGSFLYPIPGGSNILPVYSARDVGRFC